MAHVSELASLPDDRIRCRGRDAWIFLGLEPVSRLQ